jgi:hypothetical protein
MTHCSAAKEAWHGAERRKEARSRRANRADGSDADARRASRRRVARRDGFEPPILRFEGRKGPKK